MNGPGDSEDYVATHGPRRYPGLAGLRSAALPTLAARLFVHTFRGAPRTPDGGVRTRRLDEEILRDMFELGGVEYKIAIRARRKAVNSEFAQLVLECVLLWERHLLAGRYPDGGENARTDVMLLRAGEHLLSSPGSLERVTALLAAAPLRGVPAPPGGGGHPGTGDRS